MVSVMEKFTRSDLSNLDRVTATIVHEMGKIGLFHYNKLTYLFEYFFIKNFGCRYTKEEFIKLPHGPVISNYKTQITNLIRHGVFSGNIAEIHKSRKLDDDKRIKTTILSTELTSQYTVQENGIIILIRQIVNKYGHLSVDDLEDVVYQTNPVKKYLSNPFKQKTGGYILKNDCLKMKSYRTKEAEGRRLARKHLKKYPVEKKENKKILEEEYDNLIPMRPSV